MAPGTCMYTDAYDMYSRLEQWGYAHESVCHSRGEYARDDDGEGFMQYTSTPWKAFGPAAIVASPTSRRLTRQLAMVFGLL